MSLYRDNGVVLRTYKLGEADRIIVLLTRNHGKVRAVAKGVRKTKSKFGARLEPVSHVAGQFYSGRGELDIVTQVESIEHFRGIREDLERLQRASTMLEAVDQMAQDGDASNRMYTMLVGALRTLERENPSITVAGFFWKLLSMEGFEPQLDACASCDSEGPLVSFDISQGGALCTNCRRGQTISPEALRLLRLILGGQLRTALAEGPGAVATELEGIATQAMESTLERHLRSPGVLEA
ncbi:MAG: DNA repair protein RecO [Acidimicrobiales bacterium]